MSLKLTSRINLRGQGARRTLDFGQSPRTPTTRYKYPNMQLPDHIALMDYTSMKIHEGKSSANLKISERKKKQAKSKIEDILTCDI